MMKSKKLICCSIIAIVFVVTISLIIAGSSKSKLENDKKKTELKEDVISNELQQDVEDSQDVTENIENNIIDDVNQLIQDNDKKEDVEDNNQEINNNIEQPKPNVSQNNQDSTNQIAQKPIVKDEIKQEVPNNTNKENINNNKNEQNNVDNIIPNETVVVEENDSSETVKEDKEETVKENEITNNEVPNNVVDEEYEKLKSSVTFSTLEECRTFKPDVPNLRNTMCETVSYNFEKIGYRLIIFYNDNSYEVYQR